jgi:serine/threonine protein kinase
LNLFWILGTVYKARMIPVREFCQRTLEIEVPLVIHSLENIFLSLKASQSRPSSAACARPTFYAIKCISRKSLTKTTQDLLINEIKLLKHIKHENIVEMIDFAVNKIVVYFCFVKFYLYF